MSSNRDYTAYHNAFEIFVQNHSTILNSGISKKAENRVWFRMVICKNREHVYKNVCFILFRETIKYVVFRTGAKYQNIEAGTTEATMYEAMNIAYQNLYNFVYNSLV